MAIDVVLVSAGALITREVGERSGGRALHSTGGVFVCDATDATRRADRRTPTGMLLRCTCACGCRCGCGCRTCGVIVCTYACRCSCSCSVIVSTYACGSGCGCSTCGVTVFVFVFVFVALSVSISTLAATEQTLAATEQTVREVSGQRGGVLPLHPGAQLRDQLGHNRSRQ